jgi:S-adenosylmethionine:tRNA ribosyltransferase-isomerase
MVGNAKKWKSGILERTISVNGIEVRFKAELIKKLEGKFIINFSWDNDTISFSEILDTAGVLPIPPYLNRDSEESDEERYQTVYAKNIGSVAAPTAGLHFSESILNQLQSKGHEIIELTLHVGAGTFKPVSAETMEMHQMHKETVIFSLIQIKSILQNIKNKKPIIAVGTTSCRSLESLFWHGLKVKMGINNLIDFSVKQWDSYDLEFQLNSADVLENLVELMEQNQIKELSGTTELMIAPGYEFRFINGLITNFHQPQSTLLLLVASIAGNDWKSIYNEALNNNYRFLSYGDSSLILI